MTFLRTLFAWPDGITTGNLLASLLWVPVSLCGTWLIARFHHRKLHARLDRLDHERALPDDGNDQPGVA